MDAYHDAHSPPAVASLPLKTGALQGVIVIDHALSHRFDTLHIVYDGINGQLPNLDLFNTAVAIANGQMGIGVALQQMWTHDDKYQNRLQTMLRGMVNQGLGHASGPHSSFIPYHIDAVTLQAVGEGWQDEMAMGRVVESIFRSLNNLLEHFHQSFFFYLLMQRNRFVSIGTYLPSAMLVAVNFTIMAIALWIQSGRPSETQVAVRESSEMKDKQFDVVTKDDMTSLVPAENLAVVERKIFLPLAFVVAIHFLGIIPLHAFNHGTPEVSCHRSDSPNAPLTKCPQQITATFFAFSFVNLLLPYAGSAILVRYFAPTAQQFLLIKAFSLLLLGMFLSALATLNFSLALLVGLLTAPLTYVPPAPEQQRSVALVVGMLLNLVGPTLVLLASSHYWGVPVLEVLVEAAFGWDVWGMWTQVVVWCVWWPAWLIGAVLLASSPARSNAGSDGSDGNGPRPKRTRRAGNEQSHLKAM